MHTVNLHVVLMTVITNGGEVTTIAHPWIWPGGVGPPRLRFDELQVAGFNGVYHFELKRIRDMTLCWTRIMHFAHKVILPNLVWSLIERQIMANYMNSVTFLQQAISPVWTQEAYASYTSQNQEAPSPLSPHPQLGKWMDCYLRYGQKRNQQLQPKSQ